MSLFVIVALMHTLVYWGMRPLLLHHPLVPSMVMAWMAAMLLTPFAARMAERAGFGEAASALSWVGFTWMGFLWLAFAAFAVVGALELLLFLAGKAVNALTNVSVHNATVSALVLLVVMGAGLYGIYEAKDLRVERLTIETDKLPSGKSVRIVQVSDVHLGLMAHEEVLSPIVGHILATKPDLLVATGDVVDAQLDHLDGLSDIWRRVDPPLGKYAVFGNHEYYAGVQNSMEFLTDSGFKVLNDEGSEVGGVLKLVGVPDRRKPHEAAVLEAEASKLYTVFLKHRPTSYPEAWANFDLQLSGHAHKGQIFPFNFLTGIPFPMQDGLYQLEEKAGGALLYASRGTGSWGPPLRLMSPPEVTVIELVGAAGGANRAVTN